MVEALKKNEAGQWLVLSDEKKKAISDYLEEMANFEINLAPLGDSCIFFIEKQIDKIRVEPVSIERAKLALKALSDQFEERKRPLESAIEKIREGTAKLTEMIAELDEHKFYHRIEMIQEAIDKFKPHIERLDELIKVLNEKKQAKLEEAKDIIMKGHRKDYFDGLK